MLVLARYINERIMIGDDIVITVTDIDERTGRVKIGIEAPIGVRVDREEVREAIKRSANNGRK